MSCLKCLLLFLPVYLKKSLDVFPGSTHCLWCLSGLSSVSVNVFQSMSFQSVSQCLFQICLQEPLDVFQDQPTIFLPVSVWWVDVFYLSWFSIVSANIFLMRILLMSGWAELLCRQCLSGELSRCLPLSISQCLLSNLSRELLWCSPGSTHNLSSSICLLGWCVLSELVLNCVCQYLPNENPADVCLDWALFCQYLWWAQSASFHCLLLICLSSCLCLGLESC